ncbi:MAG: hypothetical protein RI930_264, partial [Pseudomonadota bacterium]
PPTQRHRRVRHEGKQLRDGVRERRDAAVQSGQQPMRSNPSGATRQDPYRCRHENIHKKQKNIGILK